MTIEELRSQALQLTASERELLAVDLFESLTSPDTQSEIDEEWDLEIAARSESVRAGTAQLLDSRESLDRIRGMLLTRESPKR